MAMVFYNDDVFKPNNRLSARLRDYFESFKFTLEQISSDFVIDFLEGDSLDCNGMGFWLAGVPLVDIAS